MTEKNEITEEVRRLVLAHAGIVETLRAEAGLTTLSFQNHSLLERHVWVDTDLDGQMVVDLEDWSTEGSWDNSVVSLTAIDSRNLSNIIVDWLSGRSVEECRVGADPTSIQKCYSTATKPTDDQ